MDPTSLAIEFTCPLCRCLPTDPVFSEDGFIYDRACIEKYIASSKEDPVATSVVSPMTGESMGTTLIASDIVKETIRELVMCEDINKGILGAWANVINEDKSTTGDIIFDTKKKAKGGDVEQMIKLAEWYLFGGQNGINVDAEKAYHWCKLAADEEHELGKAYQGYCLTVGIGVDHDWEDGYELLFEVASNQHSNGAARDFAAYTLGCCYKNGIHGYKNDEKKAEKWLGKVIHEPKHDIELFRLSDVKEETDTHELAQDKNEDLCGSMLLIQTGQPDADGLIGRHLNVGEEDHCSLPSLLSTNTTSVMAELGGLVTKCERCSAEIPQVTDYSNSTNNLNPPKLCQLCKVIGLR